MPQPALELPIRLGIAPLVAVLRGAEIALFLQPGAELPPTDPFAVPHARTEVRLIARNPRLLVAVDVPHVGRVARPTSPAQACP